MTVKLQAAVLLPASRAVQLTVVLPTGKMDPEAGLQLIIGAGSHRLVAVTTNVTVLEH